MHRLVVYPLLFHNLQFGIQMYNKVHFYRDMLSYQHSQDWATLQRAPLNRV